MLTAGIIADTPLGPHRLLPRLLHKSPRLRRHLLLVLQLRQRILVLLRAKESRSRQALPLQRGALRVAFKTGEFIWSVIFLCLDAHKTTAPPGNLQVSCNLTLYHRYHHSR
jgi:hypothetical protein